VTCDHTDCYATAHWSDGWMHLCDNHAALVAGYAHLTPIEAHIIEYPNWARRSA
jgi:hypothetical protein